MLRKLILLLLMTTIGLANVANASAHLCDMDSMAPIPSTLTPDARIHSMPHVVEGAMATMAQHGENSDTMQDHSCCDLAMGNELSHATVSNQASNDIYDESINASLNENIDHSNCGDCQLEFGSVGAALLSASNLQPSAQTNHLLPFSSALFSAPMQDTLVVPIV